MFSSPVIFSLGLLLGAGAVAMLARWQISRSLARVRAAERRARSAERLAEIGAMTGGLAHEIKNPLSTIGLNAQLLTEGLEELPSGQPVEPEIKQRLTKRLGSLRREVERLRGILTDFLEYAGELRLDLKETDLNEALDELVDFFLPQAQQQGVQLRTQLHPGKLNVLIDVPHIKQAVLNLMLNAAQAMNKPAPDAPPRPRELLIRTEPFQEKIKGQGVDRGVRLSITDTGPGIPPEIKSRLFTPYFTTKAGGTGLGLPTTRRIIEAHHGKIEVATEVGKGTEFVITLPLPEV